MPRPTATTDGWCPFRPRVGDLARIAGEVAAISALQAELRRRHPDLKTADRVAHQYQLAGGRVLLRVAARLPLELAGIGLFEPGAEHHGVGRLSTGLGCPHRETDPDFLGLMAAFRVQGARVDFLAINDPTAPTDDHRAFMDLLAATAASAGVDAPFGIDSDSLDFAAAQTSFVAALVSRMGAVRGLATAGHVLRQTKATWRSSTAYQSYWTGIVEVGATAGKFVFDPIRNDNAPRRSGAAHDHLTAEWRLRQARAAIEFRLSWTPFVSQRDTPTDRLTEAWRSNRHAVGLLTFPRATPDSEEARLWAILAAEMGVNPGNWVHDRGDTIAEPATEFEVARKIAYGLSQQGRRALPEESYAGIFATGEIDAALRDELLRRAAAQARTGHVNGTAHRPLPA